MGIERILNLIELGNYRDFKKENWIGHYLPIYDVTLVNGTVIRIICNTRLIFRDYYSIHIFVPGNNHVAETYKIKSNEENYERINKLYFNMIATDRLFDNI